MWGHQVWDAGTCGMQGRVGCKDMWDGDAGMSNIGTRECKVRGKCDISFFVKMCYLWST